MNSPSVGRSFGCRPALAVLLAAPVLAGQSSTTSLGPRSRRAKARCTGVCAAEAVAPVGSAVSDRRQHREECQ
jgi:hypothetical protein